MNKRRISDLAYFGGSPLFAKPLPVGQFYMPDRTEFESAFRAILQSRYFTNHGPRVRELDARFADHLGVKHAICVTNETVALMVAAKALDLHGEVIVPAYTRVATAQALSWAGLTPVFCDIDMATQTINADLVEPLLNSQTSAVLGVHMWGRACDPVGLQSLCKRRGLSLFFDAAHAVDCTYSGRKIGKFGNVEAFSFHASNVLNGAEGGCLTTDDDALAARIRTVRNFHVSESFSKVPLRINGKMSEAQASMALMSLRSLASVIDRNRNLYERYRERSLNWPGVRFNDYASGEQSNYQSCVLEIEHGMCLVSRDQLFRVLRAENILVRNPCARGVHQMVPYKALQTQRGYSLPETDRSCNRQLQLPLGASVTELVVDDLCDVVDLCLAKGNEVTAAMQARH